MKKTNRNGRLSTGIAIYAIAISAIVLCCLYIPQACQKKDDPPTGPVKLDVYCTSCSINGTREIHGTHNVGEQINFVFKADEYYELPDDVKITSGNRLLVKGTDYTYSNLSGKLSFVISEETVVTTVAKDQIVEDLTMTFVSPGEEEYVSFRCDGDFTGAVDWGDGVTDHKHHHTYAATDVGKEYKIIIKSFNSTTFAISNHCISDIRLSHSIKIIPAEAFTWCEKLKSIHILSSVEVIGNRAFSSCRSLEKITVSTNNKFYDSRDNSNAVIETNTNRLIAGCNNTVIPVGVTSIGDSAFADSDIKSLVVPEGVKYIGVDAFSGSSIENITLPDSLVSIDTGAFSSCGSLTSLVIPKNVKFIGDCICEYCGSLESVDILGSIDVIPKKCFRWCANLKSVILPEGITYIAQGAFYECGLLQNVILPTTLEIISDEAFERSGLTSVAIPDSVYSIGRLAFCYCDELTSVTLSNNIVNMDNPFADCDKLEFNIYDNAKYLGSNTNPYYALIESTSTDITTCDIHENCKIINNQAFEVNSNLQSINFPDGLLYCCDYFYGCNNLTTTLYDNAKYLGSPNNPYLILLKFVGDDDVASCEIHSNCKFIVERAFSASLIQAVSIPDSVTYIGYEAFYNCENLSSCNIPKNLVCVCENAFLRCKLTTVALPDSVIYLGRGSFLFNPIQSLKLSNSLKRIPDSSFSESNFTSLTIPDSVTHIEQDAFGGCLSLKNVTLPKNLISVDVGAFSNTSIESLSLPKSLIHLGAGAFSFFANLKEVTVDSQNERFSCDDNRVIDNYANGLVIVAYDAKIPDSVTSIALDVYSGSPVASIDIPYRISDIGYGVSSHDFNSSSLNARYSWPLTAFRSCQNLTSIIIPKGVSIIGELAFENCSSLTSVVLPPCLSGLGYFAFNNCTSLTSIDIPDGVEYILDYAFENTKLTSFIAPAELSRFGCGVFDGCDDLRVIDLTKVDHIVSFEYFLGADNLTDIIVPADLVDAYKENSQWSQYSSIIHA